MKKRALAGLAAALLAWFGQINAAAAYDYLEMYGYEDELARCIDLIRPALQAREGEKVTYDVQKIDLRGPWYNFAIGMTLVDRQGNKQIDNYKVGCKANRWVASARLVERRNTEPLPMRLGLLTANF